MQYFDEAKDIWQRLVPPSGQAETVQGELLRAVEKLRDEAERNGNVNYDQGHEKLLAFLRATLLAHPWPGALRAELEQDLARVANVDEPLTEDEPWGRLTDRVVEWCRAQPDLVPKPHDDTLLR